MKTPITRRNAQEIISLLDFCFRKGVLSAYEVGNDWQVKDWYDERLGNWSYGMVDYPDEEFDWRRWRFFLLKWCRENRLSMTTYELIDGVRVVQGMSYVLLLMTMRFYLLGVKEWLEYPNGAALAIFRSRRKQRWSNKVPEHMKNMKNDDFISLIQEFSYEFRSNPVGDVAKLKQNAFTSFEMAMWTMTRRLHAKIIRNTK